MTPSFNLVDEPWLPCIRLDSTIVELGLLDALVRAHELRELHGETPLVTAALHRLLLAVLHRVFGPASRRAWARLWERGRFDERALRDYLDRWRGRFDLFDAERPFFQAADRRVKPKSLNSLAHHIASGNNPTLFDHNIDEAGIALTPAQAARALIVAQHFGLAGLSGIVQKFTDAGAARGAVFVVLGGNLFETLTLNLVRYAADRPMPRLGDDRPAWEMDDPFTPSRLTPMGYLDFLTWHNRRILLMPEGTSDGVVVREMTMAPALRLDDAVQDPMTHYRRDEKRGPIPLTFFEGKALWRDSSVLFELQAQDQIPPAVFRWLHGLVADEYLPRSARYRFAAFGMSKKQAKVFFFREERLPLHLSLLADDDEASRLRATLNSALRAAERIGDALRMAGRELARWVVSPTDRNKAHRDDVKLVYAQLGLDHRYWPELGVPFRAFVDTLPDDPQGAMDAWLGVVVSTARRAFDQAVEGVSDPVRGLKAATLARGTLERLIGRVLRPQSGSTS